MQPHQHPPMTPRHRVFLAVTVLMVLTVIGLVIGCDSDDGPKVTAPSEAPTTPAPPDPTVDPNGTETYGCAVRRNGYCQEFVVGGSSAHRRAQIDEAKETCAELGGQSVASCTPVYESCILSSGPLAAFWSSRTEAGDIIRFVRIWQGTEAEERFRGVRNIHCSGTPQPTPQPSSQQWGSIAVSHTSSSYTWSIRFGRTESEARSETLAVCRSRGGTSCRSFEFTRGQCGALAVGTRQKPAWGTAVRNIGGQDSGSAKLATQNAAIANCRSAGGTNCRIDTGVNGVASRCLTSS